MPIILQPSVATTSLYSKSLSVNDIIVAVSRETRGVIDATVVADQTLLIDYLNRSQLTILRWSGWEFLQSDFQYFLTTNEQTDYWLGTLGSAPSGVVDTKLNLTDLDRIKRNSVTDITNAHTLNKTETPPYNLSLSHADASFRPAKPAEWAQDMESSPNIISLYPAPNNQNPYQPVPETPYCTFTSGGALARRTYYITQTFVDSNGDEGTVCDKEAIIVVPANMLVVVHSPEAPAFGLPTARGTTYASYKVYASTTSNTEVLQSTSITLGTSWTEPTTGLISGATAPTTNNLDPMDGYIIGFRYYRQRQQLASTTDILQVPNVYKDILIAGTTWQACQYLKLKDEAQYWLGYFKQGLTDMVRDRNTIPREDDFIRPDYVGLGIGNQESYIDVFDVQR